MSTFPADLTGTWAIDESHSTIGFAVKHAVVATTRGKFKTYSGGATIDAENPGATSIWVEIDAASVDTGNEQRDGHLQSADFWHAEANPKITYKSTSVKVDGDEIVTTGDLTVGGKTAPVDVVWEFGGVAKDPFGNIKTGFEGTATINRKDWGITWNAALETCGFLISDKVKLVLEIEANKQV
jgi:polyisoprenoid-binding protein YceI